MTQSPYMGEVLEQHSPLRPLWVFVSMLVLEQMALKVPSCSNICDSLCIYRYLYTKTFYLLYNSVRAGTLPPQPVSSEKGKGNVHFGARSKNC